MKEKIKKVFEKLRYMEPYKFSFLTNTLAIITGIILVLIDPVLYITLCLVSFALNLVHFLKIKKSEEK